jgi:hypothetical protein
METKAAFSAAQIGVNPLHFSLDFVQALCCTWT